MEKTAPLPQPADQDVADFGRVKLGACGRLPVPVPAEIADTGRIKVGACGRYPTEH